MAVHATFAHLSDVNKEKAVARFLDAGNDDGCVYELDRQGDVLCRRRLSPPAMAAYRRAAARIVNELLI